MYQHSKRNYFLSSPNTIIRMILSHSSPLVNNLKFRGQLQLEQRIAERFLLGITPFRTALFAHGTGGTRNMMTGLIQEGDGVIDVGVVEVIDGGEGSVGKDVREGIEVGRG